MACGLLAVCQDLSERGGNPVNRVPTSVICVLFVLLSSGCYISVRDDGPHDGWAVEGEPDWQHRQQRNLEAIRHLHLGRSEGSVVDDLGAPDMTESFTRDGEVFRVLFYRTRLVHEDGRTTRDETIPLVFVDGELVGWGDSAMAYARP